MVLDGKSSQGYRVDTGSIFGPTLLLYINNLPDDVNSNIAICADDTTHYSKHDQAYDLWKQLELASELRDTVDWCEKWFVDFSAGKTQLVSFNLSNNIGAINLLVAFWNR